MRLYHGTNVVIDAPRVLVPNRALDFGPGFYTTSDRAQASRWAAAVTRRSGAGTPVIHAYDLMEEHLPQLRVKRFATASAEWLDFVALHRLQAYVGPSYDLIIGPGNCSGWLNAFRWSNSHMIVSEELTGSD